MPWSCSGRVDLFGGPPEEENQGHGEGPGLRLSPAEWVLLRGGPGLSHSHAHFPLHCLAQCGHLGNCTGP